MAYKTHFTGDPNGSAFHYKTSLLSSPTPRIERYTRDVNTGRQVRKSFGAFMAESAPRLLNHKSAMSSKGPIAKRARPYHEYNGMNMYVMNEMSGLSQPACPSTWYKLSFTGDVRTPTEIPVHMWGVDLPPQHPELGGFSYEPYSYPFADEVSDAAMAKLFSNVRKSKDSDLNLGLALAELGQTVDMFCSTATRIFSSYRALRRGQVREAARLLSRNHSVGRGILRVPISKERAKAYPKSEAFINDYLAWQYGVIPLLNDLDGAAKKLASLVVSKPVVMRVNGKSSQAYQPDYTVVRTEIPGVQQLCTRTEEFELRVRHTLWYTVSDAMVAHASSLGLTNPMDLAYQTIPMSFVFDWMFSLGDWLKGFSTFHGLSFRSGCTSRSGFHRLTYNYGGMVENRYDGYTYYDGAGQPQTLVYQSYHRDVPSSSVMIKEGGFRRDLWGSFPSMPTPSLRFPATPGSAFGKLTSSLALLAQRRLSIRDISANRPSNQRSFPVNSAW